MVNQKDKPTDKNCGEGWAKAIEDAESELAHIKLRRDQLTGAIRVFKERMASGEPWPGAPATRN